MPGSQPPHSKALNGARRYHAGMIQALWEFLVAFAVAPFPAAWKKTWAEGRRDSAAAQIASGVVQFLAATVLHFVLIIRASGAFFDGPGMALFNKMADTNDGTPYNSTAIGFIGGAGYMVSPVGLFVLYLVAEGIVRALDPPLTGNRPGTALLAAPAAALNWLARRAGEKRVRLLLGPDRADEWETPGAPGGPLWYYSVRTRELSPVQCVSWRGSFFILDAPGELVKRGAGHAIGFRFRPARPGEILRCAPWVVPED